MQSSTSREWLFRGGDREYVVPHAWCTGVHCMDSLTSQSSMTLDVHTRWNSKYFDSHSELFLTPTSLVFMGSEKYPYKGIIDHLANRGFSNGTNAWTDTDNTAYTVSTAGGQGFLQLLPIYVDHILYPTLTKAGFITEVRFVPCELFHPLKFSRSII